MSKVPPPRPWGIRKPDDWGKQIRALPPNVLKKFDTVASLLTDADNPRKHGVRKTTKYGYLFVAELDRSYRLVYDVLDAEHMILIYRVGNHPDVYGKESRI